MLKGSDTAQAFIGARKRAVGFVGKNVGMIAANV